MEIQVSIIIVNYNTEKVLGDCLLSIREQTANIAYETIVIDNNSEKGSLDYLIKNFPEVNFQLMDKNWGFGMANNIASDIAIGEYLYFLNPDTILMNNAVLILSDYMDNHSQTGICGGSMFNIDGTPTTSFYDISQYRLEYEILFNLRKNYQGINYTDKPKEVLTMVGSNFFIRKNIFEEVGKFDKDFFMYFEEIELCERVGRKGYKIESVPDAQIIHYHGASAENKNDELRSWTREEHWYSKFVYFDKIKGTSQAKFLHKAHVMKFKMAILFYKMKGNKSKLEYWNQKRASMEKAYKRYKIYLNISKK